MTPRVSARVLAAALAAAALPLVAGCGLLRAVGLSENEPDPTAVRPPADERLEPDHVVVRHVLVSFEDARIMGVTRTKEEAQRLAQKVYDMAQGGRDMRELARLYSDDRHGTGQYAIANWGVATEGNEMERDRLARGFTRVAFSLEPGQVALLQYEAAESPFGWHVIRREK